MAVYAAHLTRTLQGTPTVFQVAAQEALGATVKPALRKLVEYLSSVYPNKCGWTERWFDELYLLFDCCLQYHYLKHYAASFSESFYGLVRAPVSPCGEFGAGPRLARALERGSLAMLVLLPYLRGKIEACVDKWRDDDEDGRLGKSTRDRLRKAAIRVYTVMHLTYESLKLAQMLRYLCGSSKSPALDMCLLGLTLKDAPPPQYDPEQYTWTDLVKDIFRGNIGSATMSFPMVGGVLLQCVQYGAFAVQFLRWWEARGGGGDVALPTPPAPMRDERSLRWKNKCPICLRTWKIPTVLPVSGYIFCYVCISRHVRGSLTCPVTGLPARPESLVRMFVDT